MFRWCCRFVKNKTGSLQFLSSAAWLLLVVFLVGDLILKVEALPQHDKSAAASERRSDQLEIIDDWNSKLKENNNDHVNETADVGQLDDAEEIQLERQNLMAENCGEENKKSAHKPAARFFSDQRHQLLYCYVPKAASTNLKLLMMILSGHIKAKNYDSLAKRKSQIHHDNPMVKIQANHEKNLVGKGVARYKRFLFTRHPFERLVSAYYDKFTYKSKVKTISFTDDTSANQTLPNKKTQHNKVGKKARSSIKKRKNRAKNSVGYMLNVGTKIIEKYRANPSQLSLEKGHDVTIPEFVSYVIDQWAERKDKPLDVHWRSMVDLCHPCSIKYDLIGKFETMQKDVDYLLNQLGEDKISKHFKAYEPYATSSLVKEFMEQISQQQWKSLLRIYKEDFKVFGYDPEIYRPESFSSH